MKRCYIVAMVLALAFCAACGPGPAPPTTVRRDPTQNARYLKAVGQLQSMNRQAETAYRTGKPDDAAKIMEQEKPLVSEVLQVPQPSVAAMEAASDLDQLYGTMLLNNRHYGWARILFQGNVARWKHWRPETLESARRLKLAEDGVAECDHHLLQ